MSKSKQLEIHKFKVKDKNYVIDVPTSICFEADDLAYEILGYFPTFTTEEIVSKLASKYPKQVVLETIGELEKLQKEGLLWEDKQVAEELPEEIGNITLHISHACNLRCKYCFAGQGSYGGEKENMSKDIAKKSVNFLMEQSGQRKEIGIVFFGGEPLLNFPLLKFIVDYSKKEVKKISKKIHFTITTNGTLLTDDIIDCLNKNKFSVMISIDGYKKAQDELRRFAGGKGSYDVVISGAKKLSKSRGGRLTARVTVCHDNPDVKKIADHLSEIGFSRVVCAPVSGADGTSLALTSDDIELLLKRYEQLAGEVIEKVLKREEAVMDDFADVIGQIYRAERRNHACGVGLGAIGVSPSGDIYPCHRFVGMKEFKIGHVEKGFDKAARQRVIDVNATNRKPCSTCWARYLCGGGCLHDAAKEDGSFGSPNPQLCKLQKRVFELSLMIYAELLEKAPELFEPKAKKAYGQAAKGKESACKPRT